MVLNLFAKKTSMLVTLFLTIMLFSTHNISALEKEVNISLPVKQVLHLSSQPTSQIMNEGTYELRRLSPKAPMPYSNQSDSYNFTIPSSNDQFTIPLTYLHGGQYRYQLVQTTEDVDDYVVDRTIYLITVYIKNNANGTLGSEIIVDNGSGNKSAEIQFVNTYIGRLHKVPSVTEELPNSGYLGKEWLVLLGILLVIISLLLGLETVKKQHHRK